MNIKYAGILKRRADNEILHNYSLFDYSKGPELATELGDEQDQEHLVEVFEKLESLRTPIFETYTVTELVPQKQC